MKTLGLIGGTSWVSTADYYRYLNEFTNERLGGIEFPRLVIHSLNYGEVARLQQSGRYEELDNLLVNAAKDLERCGAQGLRLGANTMHRSADVIQRAIGIPIIHIAEATANAIAAKSLKTVSLLGTRYTMEMDFFTKKLIAKGITPIIPNEEDRAFVHATIFDELGKNIFSPTTKSRYLEIIGQQLGAGAEGVILGCTEIPLLLKPEEIPAPSFDTALIHAQAAVEFALS